MKYGRDLQIILEEFYKPIQIAGNFFSFFSGNHWMFAHTFSLIFHRIEILKLHQLANMFL